MLLKWTSSLYLSSFVNILLRPRRTSVGDLWDSLASPISTWVRRGIYRIENQAGHSSRQIPCIPKQQNGCFISNPPSIVPFRYQQPNRTKQNWKDHFVQILPIFHRLGWNVSECDCSDASVRFQYEDGWVAPKNPSSQVLSESWT